MHPAFKLLGQGFSMPAGIGRRVEPVISRILSLCLAARHFQVYPDLLDMY